MNQIKEIDDVVKDTDLIAKYGWIGEYIENV